MIVAARVLPGRYVDSVVLMRLAQSLTTLAGVDDAAAMMATEANKAVLTEGKFVTEATSAAGPDDLVVAVKAKDEIAASAALAEVEPLLATPQGSRDEPTDLQVARSLEQALETRPDLNLAAISLPGEYAAAEARRALEHGLHVFLFSSNVSLADEVALKRLATERGLLCMGPDCGTAIVAGKGLGFANVVRQGSLGIVGASGTGIQAVTCLVDRYGAGVSHAIGCGSRDLHEEVGASTTLAALEALLADAATEAVLLISKSPAPRVAAELRARAQVAAKPVICFFLGDPEGPVTLDDAAASALGALGRIPPPVAPPLAAAVVAELRDRFRPEQRYIRGLYAGGTLAAEAQLILRQAGLDVASNAPLPTARMLGPDGREVGHAVVDMGAEEFTRGRPHPMIDARARRARLYEEAADSEVAVILLDFVLGHGAARDPAGDLADDIAAVRHQAAAEGRELVVLSWVCGTERDPQDLRLQERVLRDAGAFVLPTNAAAVRSAALLVSDDADHLRTGQRELAQEAS